MKWKLRIYDPSYPAFKVSAKERRAYYRCVIVVLRKYEANVIGMLLTTFYTQKASVNTPAKIDCSICSKKTLLIKNAFSVSGLMILQKSLYGFIKFFSIAEYFSDSYSLRRRILL